MISDNCHLIGILPLLRTFVNAPKGSKFAMELLIILDYYIEKSLKIAKD